MKVLITGVAGTGKSTIAKALRQRDFFAVDFSDVKDMCFWQDVKTREKVEYSPVHSHEWFNTVKRICDINILKQILAQKDNIEWQKNFDPQLLSYGAIPVNTEGGLEVVVDKIVTIIDA